MDTIEALRLIIVRCPDLIGEAASALKAIHAGSPVAEQRAARVVSAALSRHEDTFDEAERAGLAALLPVPTGGRDAMILIRASITEKARVQDAAAAAGQTMSDYIRARIGLG